MDRCGLSVKDFATYVSSRRDPLVTMQAEAQLLDAAANPQETMLGVMGGTVNVDVTQPGTPTRNATVIMLDPHHTMDWDSNSPGAGSASLNRMIRLWDVTYVPALGTRVRCPLITGPVRGFNRTGTSVTINVVGREDLMLGQAWRTKTYHQGMKKTDVIKDMLMFYGGLAASELAGIPDLPYKLPKSLSIGVTTVPWTEVQSLAGSMNRQIFFNGMGLPMLRLHPTRPCLTIYEGDQGVNKSDIVGESQVQWQLQSGWYNTVEVTGAQPNIRAVAYPPPAHPLNPHNLGANGAMIVRLYQEQNGNVRSTAEAQARATQLLTKQLAQQVQVTAISKVFPFLDEQDMVALRLLSGGLDFVMETFSIDLAGTGMSIGFNKRMHTVRAQRVTHKIPGPKTPAHRKGTKK